MGLAPIPIRWRLDGAAQHCSDSLGFSGCPGLVGVYPDGWASLPQYLQVKQRAGLTANAS